ncbi:MAG: lipoate--protein ligase [Oscillospiraceae bacterium]|nr:lipoate--protein ligase [Oscillospiraceae bacterium]
MVAELKIFRSSSFDPYYNIATEKRLLETVEPGCCVLYLWQNQNTVVIGRNQNAWAECRTSLLEEEGGRLARRLSGGGAVFHDLGNLNFTFIMKDEDYDLERQLSVIQRACGSVGIFVERSGRNDLLADGYKFSGNAFYHAQGRAYHHGTMLVNADMEKLSRYLTPSKAKLEAKGVGSVRARVINLQELVPGLTCEALADCMEQAFAQVYGFAPEAVSLSTADLQAIEKSAQELSSWQWIYGPKLPFTFSCEKRFSWGSLCLQLQVEGGTVVSVQVYSDAIDWKIANEISTVLDNCHFIKKEMVKRVSDTLSNKEIAEDIATFLLSQDI